MNKKALPPRITNLKTARAGRRAIDFRARFQVNHIKPREAAYNLMRIPLSLASTLTTCSPNDTDTRVDLSHVTPIVSFAQALSL